MLYKMSEPLKIVGIWLESYSHRGTYVSIFEVGSRIDDEHLDVVDCKVLEIVIHWQVLGYVTETLWWSCKTLEIEKHVT